MNLCVSHTETVTTVSLILVEGEEKKSRCGYDSDLNVNGFSKGPLLKMFCQSRVYI